MSILNESSLQILSRKFKKGDIAKANRETRCPGNQGAAYLSAGELVFVDQDNSYIPWAIWPGAAGRIVIDANDFDKVGEIE